MLFNSKNTADTERCGFELAKKLSTGGRKSAFIALCGEMGVGKTAFTRGFASFFDIQGVRSTTYAIVNEYRSALGRIFHFDMYRIESEDDLYSVSFYDYLNSEGYSIVEWSENIEEFIPEDAIFVEISRSRESTDGRNIEITGV